MLLLLLLLFGSLDWLEHDGAVVFVVVVIEGVEEENPSQGIGPSTATISNSNRRMTENRHILRVLWRRRPYLGSCVIITNQRAFSR